MDTMLWRVKTYVHRLRNAMRPMRERGWSFFTVLFVHVPVAAVLRAWRALAHRLDEWIQRAFNQRRFVKFQNGLANNLRPRFYLIVMPSTLHYLLPCLALLEGRAQVVLLNNGARHWESRLLRERLPTSPMFDLRTLPWSSIAHGHVINLILENERGNFGIIDHDCYVFDDAIFQQLNPTPDECVLSLYGEESRSVEFKFPLTFFLFFNTRVLRGLMRRFAIDARLYREIPISARSAMARIGLGPTTFWKSYHNFRDTLHVLLGVALAEGLQIRFLAWDEGLPSVHIGGTSIGTHHAKNLPALYIHLRFLELLDDPLLNRRYAFLTAPIRSSAEALALSSQLDPAWQAFPEVDSLIQRLREHLSKPSPDDLPSPL